MRLDFAETSKKTQKHQCLPTFGVQSVWQLQNSSFPTNVKFGVRVDKSPGDAKKPAISFALPKSSPTRRYGLKKRFLNIEPSTNSDENKCQYRHAPLNFANFNMIFQPRVWTAYICMHTNGKSASYIPGIYFFRQVVVALYFGLYRSHLSHNKKKNAGFPKDGGCMITL